MEEGYCEIVCAGDRRMGLTILCAHVTTDNDENAPGSPFAEFNRHGSEYNVLDSPDSPYGYDAMRLTPFGMVRVTRKGVGTCPVWRSDTEMHVCAGGHPRCDKFAGLLGIRGIHTASLNSSSVTAKLCPCFPSRLSLVSS